MNIKNLLDSLILYSPYLKPFLTNILSAEIKSNVLRLYYPDFLKSNDEIDIINKEIESFIAERYSLGFYYSFDKFNMPHLPYPVMSSKHRNRILFLRLRSDRLFYTIIDKAKLIDFFKKRSSVLPFTIYDIHMTNSLKLFNIIEELLIEILPQLKDNYLYLHPVILTDNMEKIFYFEILFENIFTNIENNRKIPDIKRFVGIPYYSFIDYFNYFEVEDED